MDREGEPPNDTPTGQSSFCRAGQRHLATQAKELLKQRLPHGDGREWNPEAIIWNLKLMA